MSFFIRPHVTVGANDILQFSIFIFIKKDLIYYFFFVKTTTSHNETQ